MQSGAGRPDNVSGYRLPPTPEFPRGQRVPSVSELLGRYKDSGPIIRWRDRIFRDGGDPDLLGEEAAGAGSMAHDAIEAHILGRPVVWPSGHGVDPIRLDMAQQGFESFLDWWNPAAVQILGTETPMVSQTWGFGGTPDAWGIIGGKLCLLDWKTSKEIFHDYVTQLSAYAVLLRECKGIEVEKIHVVRVGKQMAEFEHKCYGREVMELGWKCLTTRLETWKADKALDKAIGRAR
jgi:hypothetical protein